MENNQILNIIFLGNSILNYIVFLSSFALFLIFFKIFQEIIVVKISKISERAKTDIDKILIRSIKGIRFWFYIFISFYFSFKLFIYTYSIIDKILDGFFFALIVYQVVITIQIVIDYFLLKHLREKDEGTKHAITSISNLGKGLLWFFGVLLIFSNLGVNITSLVAGLGIGGIAVAIAVQNILSDLFSSFAIHFDRPFTVGDFIITGNHMGVVQKIGIKTTRLKALQGEEIVISNHELISSRIQNFKKMKERRVVFKFGVEYETPVKSLKIIPGIVEEIIKKEKLSKFDRAHFAEFSDSSLSFEIVYYILSGDYNDFMNTHQSILLQIKEKLEKEKVSMAFPSQTIYLKK